MDHHRPTWICADPTLMVVASSLSCLHRAMKVVVFRVGAGFLTEALDHAAPTYKGDTVHGRHSTWSSDHTLLAEVLGKG